MGDRAIVFFTDGETVSPAVYLHRNGSDVPSLLAAAATAVGRDPEGPSCEASRIDAPSFHAARFVGACFAAIGGDVSVGSQSVSRDLEVSVGRTVQPLVELVPGVEARQALRTFSRGMDLEAGLVVVNVRTAKWSWMAFGGHLQRRRREGENGWFGVNPG